MSLFGLFCVLGVLIGLVCWIGDWFAEGGLLYLRWLLCLSLVVTSCSLSVSLIALLVGVLWLTC